MKIRKRAGMAEQRANRTNAVHAGSVSTARPLQPRESDRTLPATIELFVVFGKLPIHNPIQ